MGLLWCLFYIAALGILAHVIGEWLPRDWLDPMRFPFACARVEREGRLYEKLGIQKWKSKLPDMSRVVADMTPKRLEGRASAVDLNVLVQETCVAELTHWMLCLCALALPVLWPERGELLMWLYILLGNLPFILIQRYNRPRLVRAAGRMKQRERKKCNENSDTVL